MYLWVLYYTMLTSSQIGADAQGWMIGESRVGTVKSRIVNPPELDCKRDISKW